LPHPIAFFAIGRDNSKTTRESDVDLERYAT
jgi:hypothetical protein